MDVTTWLTASSILATITLGEVSSTQVEALDRTVNTFSESHHASQVLDCTASNECKNIMMNLTFPWEERCEEAYQRKKAKYTKVCQTTSIKWRFDVEESRPRILEEQ